MITVGVVVRLRVGVFRDERVEPGIVYRWEQVDTVAAD